MERLKSTITFLVLAFALVFGITLLANFKSEPPQGFGIVPLNPDISKPTNNPATTGIVTKTYTLQEIQAHSDSSSCWTIVSGNVYDLTSFMDQHPGGPEAILSLCGKDGTSAFESQHGGQRRPENELQTLKVGSYKK